MMTYDERQEIEEYLTIIDKNCQRLDRSVQMLKEAINKIHCELSKDGGPENK